MSAKRALLRVRSWPRTSGPVRLGTTCVRLGTPRQRRARKGQERGALVHRRVLDDRLQELGQEPSDDGAGPHPELVDQVIATHRQLAGAQWARRPLDAHASAELVKPAALRLLDPRG